MLKKKNKYLVELGKRIRAIRLEQGLSQENLALKADIDRSYMGSIERGERNVSFITLIKIAICLRCSVSDFTQGIPHES